MVIDRKDYLIRIVRRLGLLQHLSFEYQISLNGKHFDIPLIEGLNEALIYTKPSFKADILKIIDKMGYLCQFIDIGASFGQTLLGKN